MNPDPSRASALLSGTPPTRPRLLEAFELLNEAALLRRTNQYEAAELERRARDILERLLDESRPNGAESRFDLRRGADVHNTLIRSHATARARRFEGGE